MCTTLINVKFICLLYETSQNQKPESASDEKLTLIDKNRLF